MVCTNCGNENNKKAILCTRRWGLIDTYHYCCRNTVQYNARVRLQTTTISYHRSTYNQYRPVQEVESGKDFQNAW